MLDDENYELEGGCSSGFVKRTSFVILSMVEFFS